MEHYAGDSYLISMRKLADTRVNEVFYPGGMRQGRHRHESASFSFVASGRYEERIGRQTHSRSTATLIYHPAGEMHAVTFESDVRILSVEFRNPRFSVEPPESLDRSSSHRSALTSWLGSRLVHEMARNDSASTLAIDGIIAEMLTEGSRGKVLSEQRGASVWLSRATDFIHENFTCTLNLEEIARVADVHPAHLSRVFRQRMGCTVGEYVRRLRFEYACQQILSTERSLCEVASEAGFADQSHFNRIFRMKMGMTPYKYRNVHRTSQRNARFVQDFSATG